MPGTGSEVQNVRRYAVSPSGFTVISHAADRRPPVTQGPIPIDPVVFPYKHSPAGGPSYRNLLLDPKCLPMMSVAGMAGRQSFRQTRPSAPLTSGHHTSTSTSPEGITASEGGDAVRRPSAPMHPCRERTGPGRTTCTSVSCSSGPIIPVILPAGPSGSVQSPVLGSLGTSVRCIRS